MAMASARDDTAHWEFASSSADARGIEPNPAMAATTAATVPRRATLRMV
jgi:hypothetical protein